MWTQQLGNPVRGEDGVQGRPVLWVRLKHLLDHIVQLVGQVFGQRRVSTSTHLQNQTLPAGRLKLETGWGVSGEDLWERKATPLTSEPRKNTQQIIRLSWRYWASRHSITMLCSIWRCDSGSILYTMSPWQYLQRGPRSRERREGKYRVVQGAELVEDTAQRPHIAAEHTHTYRRLFSYSFAPGIRHVLAKSKRYKTCITRVIFLCMLTILTQSWRNCDDLLLQLLFVEIGNLQFWFLPLASLTVRNRLWWTHTKEYIQIQITRLIINIIWLIDYHMIDIDSHRDDKTGLLL